MATKPVKLELNNSGAWKTLGTFDAADQNRSEDVMSTAVQLIGLLNEGKPAKQCPTLRIAVDDGLSEVLMYWTLAEGWKPKGQR
jgi:hypothetical protein